MLEETLWFETLLHLMELSVVIGIAVVTWYIKTHPKTKKDETHYQPTKHPDIGTHHSKD